jgi:uncharacterized cupin superfamily protein
MSRPTPTPNLPLRSASLGEDAWTPFERGVRFASRDLLLSDLGGGTQIGVALTVLPPGKQACPFHSHEREEEHFFVLEGRAVLRSGDDRHVMGPGDYVCFPAGTGVAHSFENPFDEPCRYLTIGNRFDAEVCTYPDSGKLLVRAGQTRVMTTLRAASLDYWHGERDDVALEPRSGDE